MPENRVRSNGLKNSGHHNFPAYIFAEYPGNKFLYKRLDR